MLFFLSFSHQGKERVFRRELKPSPHACIPSNKKILHSTSPHPTSNKHPCLPILLHQVGSLPLNPPPPSLPLHIPRHRARQTRLQHARLSDILQRLPVGFPSDVVGRLRAGEKSAHALVVHEAREAVEERIREGGAGDFIRLCRMSVTLGRFADLGGFDRVNLRPAKTHAYRPPQFRLRGTHSRPSRR